jgi:hypothetical protein
VNRIVTGGGTGEFVFGVVPICAALTAESTADAVSVQTTRFISPPVN